MTALLPARRRADAFADALDALLDGRAAPDHRFDPLLDVVSDLRGATTRAPVRAAEAFTADLRERLMAAADTELVPTDQRLLLRTAGRPGNRSRTRIKAAAAGLALVAGTAAAATASAHSVPGDSLYPFKLGTEQARSLLSFGDVAEGKDSLGRASARLDEVTGLLGGEGDEALLPGTIGSFLDDADHGSRQLFRADQADPDDATMSTVREWAGTTMRQLEKAYAAAPEALRPALARAAVLVAGIDQEAARLCAGCGARQPLTTPSDLRLAAAKSLVALLVTQSQDTGSTAGTAGPGGASTAAGGATSGHHRSGGGSGSSSSGSPDLPSLNGPLTGGADGGTSSLGGTASSSNPITGILGDPGGSGSTSGGLGGTLEGTGSTVKGATGKIKKQVDGTVKGLGDTLGDTVGDVLGGGSGSGK